MKLRLAAADRDDDDIDITPMIDCVFLLLLFFMLTSSFIEEASVLRIVLPRADDPVKVSRDDADFVSLAVDGQVFFGDEPLEHLEALAEKLAARAGDRRSRPVVIRCDARCEYRQFMQVKNVLKSAGVETLFEEVEVQP
jgi:biopolymer transport protein ExbD